MMSPKLVKLALNYLAEPLSQSSDNSIKEGIFPRKFKSCFIFKIRKQMRKTLC